MLERVWRKGNPLILLVGMQIGSVTRENSMKDPQITRVAKQSSNLTPGHIPRENDNTKRYIYPNVHCDTIYNSQDMEAT